MTLVRFQTTASEHLVRLEKLMRYAVTLPDIGAKDEQIRVSGWFVETGESVFEGDPLLQVLIAGVTVDIEAPRSGKLRETTKTAEAIVSPGDILGWIEVSQDSSLPASEG